MNSTRAIALMVIAVLILGIAYLRFDSNADEVSVPAGAKAGDLTLESCDYDTEDGSYRADCGTLVVPENRSDPQSRLIALPVKRIRARTDTPAEPIFRFEGGPGGTNMDFDRASRFADERDVVLVGYRGVDGSTVLDCPEVESALKRSADFLGQKSMNAYAAGFRSCAARLEDEGADLDGYTIEERADDFEDARKAFGYGRVDLLSESAGTRYALVYAWRHPGSVHRSVMIAANPPGRFLWDARLSDEQIRSYAELCSQDGDCRARTPELVASMRHRRTHMPDRWLFLPIKRGHAQVASFYGLMESTAEAEPLSAPDIFDAWHAADDGDASGLWFMSFFGDLAFPESFVWGELASMGRIDNAAARAHFSRNTDSRSILGNPGTRFIWADGRLADAWPAPPSDEYSRMRTSRVETLVVGGTLDGATSPRQATSDLMPYLPNGRQVLLEGIGHTIDFWSYDPAASTRLIDTFLTSGEVDDSLYEPREVDFTPDAPYPALAKGVLGTMIGLALITVLSLFAMWRRVRRNGRIGRRASVWLRAAFPIVLGLGGWFLCALVALTVAPTLWLGSELFSILSVGTPIGIGAYLAWVQRDSSADTKLAGAVAALGGALAGAWFGFGALEGLGALGTTIVGAAALANLTLIAFDVARTPRIRTREKRLVAAA